MYGTTNVASASGGASSYTGMKSGSLTQAGSISFAFKEIDTIVNDSVDDLTLTFHGEGGMNTFLLKAGESIGDVHFSGTKIDFAGTTVNARYILLG